MKRAFLGIASVALCTSSLIAGAQAATATRASFGARSDGTKVEAVTLTNGMGLSARIMTLGATLQSLVVPDKAGHKDDVVLGYDTAQEYLTRPNFFGASVAFSDHTALVGAVCDGDLGSSSGSAYMYTPPPRRATTAIPEKTSTERM